MNSKRQILVEEAHSIGMQLGINWTKIDLEEFRRGLEFELENRTQDSGNNNDELILMGKIAWSHLTEIRDFYTLLDYLSKDEKLPSRTTDWLLGRVRKRVLPMRRQ